MARTLAEANAYYEARYHPDANPDDATATEDAAEAETALAEGNAADALHALAGALLIDPFNCEWRALLDRAYDAAGPGAGIVIGLPDQRPYLGFWALKAYSAYRGGEYAKAFNELQNLTRNFPHTFFTEAWGLDWLTDDAIRTVGHNDALRVLGTMVTDRYPEAGQVSDWGREQLNRAIAVMDRVEALTGPSAAAVVFRGQMLSKAGRFAEAVAMAERQAEDNPTFETATAAAMAHKRAGDVETAVQWFRRASELDPTNETGLLDIGDTRLDQGRWQDALDAYEEAMRRKPNHDWAHPSAVCCRYRLTGDAATLEELRYMANAGPDECGMAGMMKQMLGGYNFEDRRLRAEALMRLAEPDFVPTPRPHEHGHDEGEEDPQEDFGDDEPEPRG